MKYFRIDYVELPSGNVPFETFLNDLSIRERTEVFALIEVVKSKKKYRKIYIEANNAN